MAGISVIRDRTTIFVSRGDRHWQTTCANLTEARALVAQLNKSPDIVDQWMTLTSDVALRASGQRR